MIQDAATSYEQSLSNRAENAEKAKEQAEKILDIVFKDYIQPEIEYGHFSVTIPNYTNVLNIMNSDIAQAFLDSLKNAGYTISVTSVAISSTNLGSSGTLMISWNLDDTPCINRTWNEKCD